MAIALDGGVPDGADRPAGQSRFGIFKRQRDGRLTERSPLIQDDHGRRRDGAWAATAQAGTAPSDPAPSDPAPSDPAPSDTAQPDPAQPGTGPPGTTPPGIADQSGQAALSGEPAPLRELPDAPLVARTESMAPAPYPGDGACPADFDTNLLKESFACVTATGPPAMEYFYARLFTVSPETRGMFPTGMIIQRERAFAALTRLVEVMDSPHASAAYLTRLGEEHRKYGVQDQHYDAFCDALLDTVATFNGPDWTPETATAWRGALDYAARMMQAAASADARDHPPWWVGEIVRHDRRTETVAVLTIRPDQPLPYRAGQYLPVQVTKWPRVWRTYSIANSPGAGGLIDLHVRAVPGGLVSTTLVRDLTDGDSVLLGPASGEMTAPGNDRDLLCVAGGTGLAPIKAIIEAAGRRPPARPRKVTLFVGAAERHDLYDLPDLLRLAAAVPGLQIIPVLSGEPDPPGGPGAPGSPGGPGSLAQPTAPGAYRTGLLPDVVRAHGLFENSEAFICGPPAMVRQTALLLAAHVPAGQIHYDPLPDPTPYAGGAR